MTTPLVGELDPDDVAAYTGGRLDAGDDETQRMLNAVLSAARGAAGWHVSPVKTDDVLTVEGLGRHRIGPQHVLWLPTQWVVALKQVTVSNDAGSTDLVIGTDVRIGPQNAYQPSPVGVKLIRRGGYWHGGDVVTVKLDHGFDPDTAADWRQAILDMVDDIASIKTVGRADTAMTQKIVDDWRGQWTPEPVLPENNVIMQRYTLASWFA